MNKLTPSLIDDIEKGKCRVVCDDDEHLDELKLIMQPSVWPIFLMLLVSSLLSSVAILFITASIFPLIETWSQDQNPFIIILLASVFFAISIVMYRYSYRKLGSVK